MTWFVKLVLLLGALACCYHPLVTGSPLVASTGNKIGETPVLYPCVIYVMDMGILLSEGENYTHGCDFYECVDGQLSANIHQCEKTLSAYAYSLCLQWSDDRCCCDVVGCEDVHGEVHEVGSWYQTTPSTDPDRPECGTTCLCEAGPRLCTPMPNACMGEDTLQLQ